MQTAGIENEGDALELDVGAVDVGCGCGGRLWSHCGPVWSPPGLGEG